MKLKAIVAAAALAAVAGQASAAIAPVKDGSELVFFAWSAAAGAGYQLDLGILFSDFTPAGTTTTASNFSQSVLGSSWNDFLGAVGGDLSDVRWGVVGALAPAGSISVNGGQQLITTIGQNQEFGLANQHSGNLKGGITNLQNNFNAVNGGSTDYSANEQFFNADPWVPQNWSATWQDNLGNKLGFVNDNAIGQQASFVHLAAQAVARNKAVSTYYEGAFNFDGSTLSYTVSAVPEPTTYAMMAAGLALVGGVARRRKAAK